MVTGNLVGNCGFETGDFTTGGFWTLAGPDIGDPGLVGVEGTDSLDGISPNSGNYQAYFADLVGDDTTISQQLFPTQTWVGYTVTFYLANDTIPDHAPTVGSPNSCTVPTAECNNEISVTLGSTTVFSQTNVPQEGYTEYSFNVISTTPDPTLSIKLANGPSLSGFLLDDISVVQTPEPSAWVLMLLVAGGCFFLLRRKFSHGVAK